MSPNDGLFVLAVLVVVAMVTSVWVIARHLSATRQARAQLTGGQDYRALADAS
jgi:hypothetical protein